MENLYNETLKIMKKYNVVANKKYGQNFLIDENIIESIMGKAEISKNDVVIEIGPGLGTLTKYLLKTAGKVIAVELDEKMIDVISKRFAVEVNNLETNALGNKLEIINDDILKVDLESLISNELNSGYSKVKVVANLPYYITTPIIMKLLEGKLSIESITVMVQKEVAERLAEIPGGKETGAITYTIYYYSDANIVVDVPKECFIPVPEVNSAVIKFSVLKESRICVENEEELFKTIKKAFLMKRKTIVNSLNGYNNKNKDEIINILRGLNINEKARAEQLTLEDFVKISEMLSGTVTGV